MDEATDITDWAYTQWNC